jgi:hypothetical protein
MTAPAHNDVAPAASVADRHSPLLSEPGDPRGTFGVSAAAYAGELGWSVFPCCHPDEDGTCACGRNHPAAGKAPLTPRGSKDATTDPLQIEAWRLEYPRANIGVALEPSGLLVVDMDSPAAIKEAERLGLPETAVARTGKGRHAYYRLPAGCPPGRAIHRGDSRAIDILSAGYTILPESRHRSGATYEWITPPSALPGGLPDAPPWVVAMLSRPPDVLADERTPSVTPAQAVMPDGLHPDTAAIWTGASAASTPDGRMDRSQTMFNLSRALAYDHPEWDAERLAGVLMGWDLSQDHPKYAHRGDRNRRYLELAQKGIDSGYTLARLGDEDADAAHAAVQPGAMEGAEPTEARWCERYLARHPHTAYSRGAWKRYVGGIWTTRDELEVKREVMALMGARMKNRTVNDVLALIRAQVAVPPTCGTRTATRWCA